MEKLKALSNLALLGMAALILFFVLSGNSKLSQAQALVAAAGAQIVSAQDSLSSVQNRIGLVLDQAEATRSRLAGLEMERSNLRRQIDDLSFQSQQDLAAMRKENEALTEKLENLRNRASQLDVE